MRRCVFGYFRVVFEGKCWRRWLGEKARESAELELELEQIGENGGMGL